MIAALLAAAALASVAPEARFERFRYVGSQPAHAGLRVGSGEFLNPILEGFRPDPSLTRKGADYYLAVSSFGYFPGIPIFTSRDLVHWREIGAAISRPSQLSLDGQDTSGGLYAPDIKVHHGRFYLLNTCLGCGGNYVVTAKDAAGPWSDPTWLPFPGIDPAVFFDDDGRAWVVNNGPPEGEPRWSGHRAIWLQELDLKTLKMTGPRQVIVDGGADPSKKPVWIEGPHILKRDGRYYLICAEGGTGDQHSEVVFRADVVTGPYLPGPNPILTQRDLDPRRPHPITSTGHVDMIETPAGEWWAVFLGTRPYGDDLYNTGRETFLLPVRWSNGWPRILHPGEAVPLVVRRPKLPTGAAAAEPTSGDFAFADDFAAPRLKPGWTKLRTPIERWWRAGAGALVIAPRSDGLGGKGRPAFLARRQAHMDASAEVSVRFDAKAAGDRAGLAAFQDVRHFFLLDVGRDAEGRRVVQLERRAGKDEPEAGRVVASAALQGREGAPVRLRVVARGPAYTFSYRTTGGAWRTLGGEQDGSMLSTKSAGGFTGVMLGVYAQTGPTAAP